MDFWSRLFDNDYKQRTDIETLKQLSKARNLARIQERRQVQDLQQRVEDLEEQIGELALLCRSLLTILREDGTVRPERFDEVLRRVDAEDGVVDGKWTPPDPTQDLP